MRLRPSSRRSCIVICLLAGAAAAIAEPQKNDSFRELLGDRFSPATTAAATTLLPAWQSEVVHRWNTIAINASGLDHTPVGVFEDRIFGQQIGPGRASRAMAIVHIAIADAVTAARGGFRSFTGVRSRARTVSMEAAVAKAAHDTLVSLYPSQTASFDMLLEQDLLALKGSKQEIANGQALGERVAATIIAARANDGWQIIEPKVNSEWPTSNAAGHWRQDPISRIPTALGAHWGECTPFVVQSSSQFRTAAPPAMTSAEYTVAFNEVKSLGGDGTHTATQRIPDQTFAAIFWAYDGTPSLCAPPRLYNQIAVQIADQNHLNSVQLARLLALVNVAMADTGYTAWESKYHWDFWRPIGGLREADPGTGPSGTGDGNDATVADPNFMPLGAPASNLMGPNFTPPFPAYPSGHAAFGGALFQVLRRYFGTDRLGFTFLSDEFNGVTKDNAGNIRPYMPRSFSRFSQAEEENGQSRIYLGIHWAFDKTAGILQGRQVANYVFDRVFHPESTRMAPGVPVSITPRPKSGHAFER